MTSKIFKLKDWKSGECARGCELSNTDLIDRVFLLVKDYLPEGTFMLSINLEIKAQVASPIKTEIPEPLKHGFVKTFEAPVVHICNLQKVVEEIAAKNEEEDGA